MIFNGEYLVFNENRWEYYIKRFHNIKMRYMESSKDGRLLLFEDESNRRYFVRADHLTENERSELEQIRK